MSVTVHQILNDAKRLVSRLRDHETTADTIISQTQTLYKNVEGMREYNEEATDLNLANQIKNRPVMVFNVQQENKHIRELQQENRELRDMLEQHQFVLEKIMSKYRQQISNLIKENPTVDSNVHSDSSQELQRMADRICEMAEVMKQSIKIDDNSYLEEQEKLTQLITENKGLRELLDISRTYGSLQVPILSPEMADKEIQTETT